MPHTCFDSEIDVQSDERKPVQSGFLFQSLKSLAVFALLYKVKRREPGVIDGVLVGETCKRM